MRSARRRLLLTYLLIAQRLSRPIMRWKLSGWVPEMCFWSSALAFEWNALARSTSLHYTAKWFDAIWIKSITTSLVTEKTISSCIRFRLVRIYKLKPSTKKLSRCDDSDDIYRWMYRRLSQLARPIAIWANSIQFDNSIYLKTHSTFNYRLERIHQPNSKQSPKIEMKFSIPTPGGGSGITLFSKLIRTKDLRKLQGDDPRSTKPKLTVNILC